MSNVFTNSDYAVLSVMDVERSDNSAWVGSTVFAQRKPEANYGNLTILSYGKNNPYNLVIEDFNVQARFEANVVPTITSQIADNNVGAVNVSNSNISVNSYRANGTLIT